MDIFAELLDIIIQKLFLEGCKEKTIEEIENELGFSKSQLYRWINYNVIPDNLQDVKKLTIWINEEIKALNCEKEIISFIEPIIENNEYLSLTNKKILQHYFGIDQIIEYAYSISKGNKKKKKERSKIRVDVEEDVNLNLKKDNVVVKEGMMCLNDITRFEHQKNINAKNIHLEESSLKNEPLIVHTLNAARSSNDEASRLISIGSSPPFIVHVWNQTNGRGKADRIWAGGAGILTASWVYKFIKGESSPKIINVIGVIAALAVRDSIAAINKNLKNVMVKWPNDIIIDGKKVCGILIEVNSNASNSICIIGIGVNVCRIPILTNQKKYLLPPIAIFDDYLNDHDREERIISVRNKITNNLNRRINRFFSEESISSQIIDWDEYDYLKNKDLELMTPQSDVIVNGICKGINSSGQLRVELFEGYIKDYYSGEVSTVRGAFENSENEKSPVGEVQRRILSSQGTNSEVIVSPMPGVVVKIFEVVKVGAMIKENQILCTIESMKMEFEIVSDFNGIILEICCSKGSFVKAHQVLFIIEREKKDS